MACKLPYSKKLFNLRSCIINQRTWRKYSNNWCPAYANNKKTIFKNMVSKGKKSSPPPYSQTIHFKIKFNAIKKVQNINTAINVILNMQSLLNMSNQNISLSTVYPSIEHIAKIKAMRYIDHFFFIYFNISINPFILPIKLFPKYFTSKIFYCTSYIVVDLINYQNTDLLACL